MKNLVLIILSSALVVNLANSQVVFNEVFNNYDDIYYLIHPDNSYAYYFHDKFQSSFEISDTSAIAVGASYKSHLFGDTTAAVQYHYLTKFNSKTGDTIFTKKLDLSSTINDVYKYENQDKFLTFGCYRQSNSCTSSIVFIDNLGNYINDHKVVIGSSSRFIKAKTQDNGATFDIIGISDTSAFPTSKLTSFVIKVDTQGNILNQYYGLDSCHYPKGFYDIEYGEDSSLFIIGTYRDHYSTSRHYLLKIDKNYNYIEDYIFDFNSNLSQQAGLQESLIYEKDGLVFCGKWYSGSSRNQAVLSKIDFNGNLIWQYESSVFDKAEYNVLKKTKDQHYIVAGQIMDTNSIDLNSFSICLLSKITNNGELIWSRYISSSNSLTLPEVGVNDVIQTNDGGLLISGFSRKIIYDNVNDIRFGRDGWLCKTDSCGFTTGAQPQALLTVDSVIGTTVYITNRSTEYCTANLQLGNGDSLSIYAYSQYTNGENPNQLQYSYTDTGTYTLTLYTYAGDAIDIFTTTVHVKDTLTSTQNVISQMAVLNIYPNPVSNYIILQTSVTFTSGEGLGMGQNSSNEIQAELYTITGHKVHEFAVNEKLLQQKIDLPNLNNGVYILKISKQDYPIATKRISIVK